MAGDGDDVFDEKRAALVLDQTWKYFQLHAAQRISVFNFFVVTAGLLFSGEVAAIRTLDKQAWLGVPGGILLILLALVFWKLDQRNAALVKSAEATMTAAEAIALPSVGRIFTHEASKPRTPNQWTIGYSFRVLFIVVAAAGLVTALVAARQIATTPGDPAPKAIPSGATGGH